MNSPNPLPELPDSTLKRLLLVGGVAPWVAVVFYLSEFIFIPYDAYPTSIEGWYLLFQRSQLLGLFYMNVLDIFSVALLGLMFVALYAALRRGHPSGMAIATFWALLGVVVFIGPRVALLSVVSLSDRYALAATEVERARLLAAGEALSALGTPTPQTIGFLFMSIGVLLISVIMWQNRRFGKVTPGLGLLASVLTIGEHLSLLFAPALATPLMIASGLGWFPWWIGIGWTLLQLGRHLPEPPRSPPEERLIPLTETHS